MLRSTNGVGTREIRSLTRSKLAVMMAPLLARKTKTSLDLILMNGVDIPNPIGQLFSKVYSLVNTLSLTPEMMRAYVS